jgi:hypothetical protein
MKDEYKLGIDKVLLDTKRRDESRRGTQECVRHGLLVKARTM